MIRVNNESKAVLNNKRGNLMRKKVQEMLAAMVFVIINRLVQKWCLFASASTSTSTSTFTVTLLLIFPIFPEIVILFCNTTSSFSTGEHRYRWPRGPPGDRIMNWGEIEPKHLTINSLHCVVHSPRKKILFTGSGPGSESVSGYKYKRINLTSDIVTKVPDIYTWLYTLVLYTLVLYIYKKGFTSHLPVMRSYI